MNAKVINYFSTVNKSHLFFNDGKHILRQAQCKTNNIKTHPASMIVCRVRRDVDNYLTN